MPLCDVRDFVGQDAGQFAFVLGRHQQARMHADIAARQGKRVDGLIVDDEELERKSPSCACRDQFLADVLDVFLDFRIGDDPIGHSQAVVDGPANLQFLVAGQHGVRRAANIRQILVRVLAKLGIASRSGKDEKRVDEQAGRHDDRGTLRVP